MLADVHRMLWWVILLFCVFLTSTAPPDDRTVAIDLALAMEVLAMYTILIGWTLLTRGAIASRLVRESRHPKQAGVVSLWIGSAA